HAGPQRRHGAGGTRRARVARVASLATARRRARRHPARPVARTAVSVAGAVARAAWPTRGRRFVEARPAARAVRLRVEPDLEATAIRQAVHLSTGPVAVAVIVQAGELAPRPGVAPLAGALDPAADDRAGSTSRAAVPGARFVGDAA